MKYKPVIGLEVHIELKTKSKMFCSCSTEYFGLEPNTHTCPVCLGLPGALPVPNEKAIEWCQMLGSALNCELLKVSKFDRKNYFYPDLPKGYQISQYDEPFGINGSLKIKNQKSKLKNTEEKIIRIRRVHMEEDTGKLLHEGLEKSTLVDFNRSGVPLVEIVTEPDFDNATDVKEYLQKLQQIARYLEVSDADMEKGEMRLEPNISLRAINTTNTTNATNTTNISINTLPSYKVEVKNINSFRFVEKAINFEIERQAEILSKGETPVQETRGWNEAKNATVSQRVKEEASDYRYFPEPDIPPFRFTESQISNIKSHIPELPEKKQKRFEIDYKISTYDAEILTRERSLADYFEEAVRVGKKYSVNPKQIANFLINRKPDIEKTLPAELIEMILATQATDIGKEELKKAALKVFEGNPKAVEEYKNGKTQVLGFLIGKIKALLPQNAATAGIKEMIDELVK